MSEDRADYNPTAGMMSLQSRIAEKIALVEGGCWVWTGAMSEQGYGITWAGHRTIKAHRYVYEFAVGPVPEGMDLDHLCRCRACVNPAHLEPVTRSENLRRGHAAAPRPLPTHCKRGHAYDEANTYTWRGRRNCRACHALRARQKRTAA